MIRRWLRIAALILLAGSGCFSDPGYDVTVENQTDTAVVFFVEGTNATPGSAMAEGTTLRPGGEKDAHWIIPSGRPFDNRKATVRARGVGGDQVYCRTFGFEDLKQIRFHIVLTAGVSDCP